MDGIAHFHAVGLKQFGEFPQGVLGLGYGEAIARHEHHPLGLFQGHGTFLGTAAGDAGVARLAGAAAAPAGGPEGTTEQHRDQRAVHGRAHHLGEDQARRPHHGAGHDQQLAAHYETRCSSGHAGIGIQQRNHHGHVSSADRQGDPNPQQGGCGQQ